MILVTGANGFLGSFICRQLLSEGLAVRALVRETSDLRRISGMVDDLEICISDLLDLPGLKSCFNGVTAVIHCGAKISFDGHDCDELIRTNIESTRNVVNLSLMQGVSKFVHLSSTAAIGRSGNTDILDEDSEWNETKYTSCYGKSKYLAELEVWRGQSEGLDVTVLNPSVILGRQTYGESSGKLINYAMEPHRFYPTGNLNYVDVRDVAKIAVRMLDEGFSGKKYILNAGSVSYLDFFTEAARLSDIKPPSVAAEGWKLRLAIWGDLLRSIFTGKRRVLSREMVRSAASTTVFSNSRVINELNYSFIPFSESMSWIFTNKDTP